MIGRLLARWGVSPFSDNFIRKDSNPLISLKRGLEWNYEVLLRLAGRHLAKRMRSKGQES